MKVSDLPARHQGVIQQATDKAGSQKPLFAPAHEPVKIETPEAPRIGSKNAANPEHTGQMFSGAGKSAQAEQMPWRNIQAPPQHSPEELRGMSDAELTYRIRKLKANDRRNRFQNRALAELRREKEERPSSMRSAQQTNKEVNERIYAETAAKFRAQREREQKENPAPPMKARYVVDEQTNSIGQHVVRDTEHPLKADVTFHKTREEAEVSAERFNIANYKRLNPRAPVPEPKLTSNAAKTALTPASAGPSVGAKLKARINEIQAKTPYGQRVTFKQALAQAKKEMNLSFASHTARELIAV